MWEENLKRYDDLVDKCPRFERKGKTVPYTSANGYMFSILNKAGELGIRFSKEVQKKYLEEYNTELFKAVTIGRLLGHLGTLLESIESDPDQPSESTWPALHRSHSQDRTPPSLNSMVK